MPTVEMLYTQEPTVGAYSLGEEQAHPNPPTSKKTRIRPSPFLENLRLANVACT